MKRVCYEKNVGLKLVGNVLKSVTSITEATNELNS